MMLTIATGLLVVQEVRFQRLVHEMRKAVDEIAPGWRETQRRLDEAAEDLKKIRL